MLPLLALVLAVQSPAQRDTVEAWRARLAAETDSTVLRQWERDGIVRARADRDNPMRHLELGFLAYRLGEVTGADARYDDAAGEFEWAADLAPDWPYAWYGIGLSELAFGEHQLIAVENIRQILGRDRLTKAANAFARAAETDPGFAVAVISLAETALEQRQRARLDMVVRVLRTASAATTSPQVLLWRGRMERQAGEGDSAWIAFERYLVAGGDPALGRLEQARTAFWLERPDTGRQLYFGGATLLEDAEAREAYRADVRWIATPAELADFDATELAGVRDWLRIFWNRRDADAARAPGERLAEHYRRLAYARRHYGLASRHRFYDIADRYRSDQREVDDRGVIYIRHGEPVGRASYISEFVDFNESWRYDFPDDTRLFHFRASGDATDFRLVETLAAAVNGDQTSLFASAGQSADATLRELYESRGALDSRYQRSARGDLTTTIANERTTGRRAIQFGTTTDSWGLRFGRTLDATVRTFIVTDSAGGARVLAVFAVPGRALSARTVSGGVAYPVRFRLYAIPPEGPPVVLDTLRTFVASGPLGEGEQLTGIVELPVPSGTFDFRMVVADGNERAGDVAARNALTIPRFADGGFALSDLVLGDSAHALAWYGLGEPVAVSPLSVWAGGGRLELYFEIHGLEANYRARLEVRGGGSGSIFRRIGRLFGGGGAAVALEWSGAGTGPITRVRQSVDLDGVGSGNYRLILRVEGPDGVRITREVPFRVLEPD